MAAHRRVDGLPSRDGIRWVTFLGLLALACASSGQTRESWSRIPVAVEVVGDDTYAHFQPVRVSQLRLRGAAPGPDQVRVWGVAGRVKDFTIDRAGRDAIVRFAPAANVAEIVLLDFNAGDMRVEAPTNEIPSAAPRPPDPNSLEDLGEFKITYYWVQPEAPFADRPADTPLHDPQGGELGRFAAEFVRRVKIEGTGKLRDGRIINVSGKDGTFAVARCPNGLGTGGHHLIPFRSVAVDRSVVPIGAELFIPAAVGAKLPDGTVHDGRFWAHDVGGGIRGQHLDLFTGIGDRREPLERAGLMNLKETRVFGVLKGAKK